MLRHNFLFFLSLLGLSQLNFVHSAPRIREVLTENGLIYCTSASDFSLNPHQAFNTDANMNIVAEQIYNKLFEIKDHGSALVPVLAKSYSISHNGKEILINLRKGIKFHHTPWFTPTRDFNATDVIFSINQALGRYTYLSPISHQAIHKNPQYKIFYEHTKSTFSLFQ